MVKSCLGQCSSGCGVSDEGDVQIRLLNGCYENFVLRRLAVHFCLVVVTLVLLMSTEER